MIRLDRELVRKIRSVAARHPLKPPLRATIERAIELMIEDLEVEIHNAKQ